MNGGSRAGYLQTPLAAADVRLQRKYEYCADDSAGGKRRSSTAEKTPPTLAHRRHSFHVGPDFLEAISSGRSSWNRRTGSIPSPRGSEGTNFS